MRTGEFPVVRTLRSPRMIGWTIWYVLIAVGIGETLVRIPF